ncbi:MAG: hypothetical protein ACKOAL_03755 [Chthoniobacterales bacterium]
MKDNHASRTKGVSLWVFVTGFAAAALLTLSAAIGTSMLRHQTPEQARSLEAPVAQR